MRNWFHTLRRAFHKPAPRRPIRPRLTLESLEDRRLLAGNILASPLSLSVVESAQYSGPVATFRDTNNSLGAGDFTASIDWGDQNSTAGSVTVDGHGNFTVNGSHTYKVFGEITAVVQIQANDGGSATVQDPVSVAEAPIVAQGVTIHAAVDFPFSGAVATFTQADPHAQPGNFTATIDWGDGNVSPGNISEDSSGTFTVRGLNTYHSTGTLPVTVQIAAIGISTTANTQANVQASILEAVGQAIQATEGQSFQGTVAVLTSGNSQDTAGGFSVTIDWGDGHTTSGSVVSSGNGVFQVQGSDTFAEEGHYQVSVTIQGPHGESTSASATAIVVDAALNAVGVTVNVPKIGPINNAVVAHFTDSGGPEVVGNYTASIDWGDGTAASQGTVTLDNGTFTVTGSHTFTLPGRFPMSVTVKDEGGATDTTHPNSLVGSLNERFVAKVYQQLLMRPVDPVGLAAFAGALDRGELTRTQVVQIIESSQEYRIKVVTNLYTKLLGRPPDAAGLAAFVNYLGAGGTIGDVKALILSSDEYFLGKGGGTNAGWLAAMYQDILGRPPDPVGLQFFGGLLNSGASRLAVALMIVKSQESNTILVNGFYQTYLNRPADPFGLNTFVNALDAGVHEQDIVAIIMGSDEYFAMV
jgi:hypothetical protein